MNYYWSDHYIVYTAIADSDVKRKCICCKISNGLVVYVTKYYQ